MNLRHTSELTCRANAQGLTHNEDGVFSDRKKLLRDTVTQINKLLQIDIVANSLVALYSLYKILF